MDEVTTLMKDLIPFVFGQNDNIEVSKKQILCELSKIKSEVDKQEQKDHQKAASMRARTISELSKLNIDRYSHMNININVFGLIVITFQAV